MTRGAVVIAALAGDFGTGRPHGVMRSDRFADHVFVTLIPFTITLRAAPPLRIAVAPSAVIGLTVLSEAMIGGLASGRATRVLSVIGQLAEEDTRGIERALLVYLGFAD